MKIRYLILYLVCFVHGGGESARLFRRVSPSRGVRTPLNYPLVAARKRDPFIRSVPVMKLASIDTYQVVGIDTKLNATAGDVEGVHRMEWPELIVFTDEALKRDPAIPRIHRLMKSVQDRTGLHIEVCNIDRDAEARRAWHAVHMMAPDLPRYMPLCYNRKTGAVNALPCSVSDLTGWALGRPSADDRPDPSSEARVYGEEKLSSEGGAQPPQGETETEAAGHPLYLHSLGFDDFIAEPLFRVQALFDSAQRWLLQDGWRWALRKASILCIDRNRTMHTVLHVSSRVAVDRSRVIPPQALDERHEGSLFQRSMRLASKLSRSVVNQSKDIAVEVFVNAVDKLVI